LVVKKTPGLVGLQHDHESARHFAHALNEVATYGGAEVGGRLDLIGGNLDHLAHGVDHQTQFDPLAIAHRIEDHDAGLLADIGCRAPKARLQIDDRHHHAAQVHHPAHIFGCVGQAGGIRPPLDLTHRHDVDAVFLLPDGEGKELLRGTAADDRFGHIAGLVEDIAHGRGSFLSIRRLFSVVA
jgi:hypothetical protein